MRCAGQTTKGKRCKNTQASNYCRFHGLHFNFANDHANIAANPQVYCGADLILPEDYDIFGSRNKCLKKGVGIGMGESDSKRQEFMYKPYIPKPGKIYCGDKDQLPAGYTSFGNLQECLKKGVGVGLIMDQTKRKLFQSKPKPPLGKKELITLAQRLGIQNISQKTRAAVEQEISDKIV